MDGNIVEDNNRGIYISYTRGISNSGHRITHNTIVDQIRGIGLGTCGNTVTDNTVTTPPGLQIADWCGTNDISGNTFP